MIFSILHFPLEVLQGLALYPLMTIHKMICEQARSVIDDYTHKLRIILENDQKLVAEEVVSLIHKERSNAENWAHEVTDGTWSPT